jgi:hypothetical protein
VIAFRMTLDEYEGSPVAAAVADQDDDVACPSELNTKEDKKEGDRRRQVLVQKAEDREDLISNKAPRGERVKRLLERRVVLLESDDSQSEDGDDY